MSCFDHYLLFSELIIAGHSCFDHIIPRKSCDTGVADDVKIKPRRLFKEIDQARPRPKIESVKAKFTLACDSIHVVFKTRKSKAALSRDLYR